MLNKEQKQEVRQMIEDVIGKNYAEIKGMLNTMSANLVRIEGITSETREHARKTNGRVTKLEEEVEELQKVNLVHVVNCPNTKKIEILEKFQTERDAVKKFAWGQVVVASAIIGFVIAVLEILFGK